MDQQINIQQNIQAISLTVYDKHFVIQSHHKKANIQKKLVLDRIPGKIQEIKEEQLIEEKQLTKQSFSIFLGIITIVKRVYLVFGEEVKLVCAIEGQDVFELKTVQFIPFENQQDKIDDLYESFIENSNKASESIEKNQTKQEEKQDQEQVDEYITGIKKLLNEGYYFSYGYDLTLSKIKQSQQTETQSQYLWNFNLFLNLLNKEIDEKWLCPLIQGYCGHIQTFLNSKKLDYILISRRSSKRAGTRYSHRGIDDEGNVANFVETEQIVYYNGYCLSHLQIRGSVPTFWQQLGLTAQSKISRNYELTNNAFIKHFDTLTQNYSRILCVNLMGRNKKNEQMITETYEKHIQMNNMDNVKYEYFDYHHATKGQQFQKANPLILKLEHLNKIFRFYVEDMNNETVLLTQKGIIRSNCLDCLDRTNLFMTKIAAITFQQMMKQFDIDLKDNILNGQDILTQLDNLQINNHSFIVAFKNIWADNGDMISYHYTGTGSTHTNVTRTGKRDIKGLLDHGKKTLGRFYMQNFEDSFKQQLIDIFLGNHVQTQNIFDIQLQKELKNRETEYCNYDFLNLSFITWNTNNYVPSPNFEIDSFFIHNPQDIIVVGLQEVNSSIVPKWQKVLENAMNKLKQQEYMCIFQQSEYELCTFIYVLKKHFQRVKNINEDVMRLGLLNNKGAILVKFNIDDSDICIINCQLDSGTKDMQTRLQQIQQIHDKGFQSEGVGIQKEKSIKKMNFRFLMGDLNFKIKLQDADVRDYVRSYQVQANLEEENFDTLDYLYKQDEFQILKTYDNNLAKYQEKKIQFQPTSKYDQYSRVYSSNTTPSFNQRILIASNTNSKYNIINYLTKTFLESTSRPVQAMFQIEVKQIDYQRKTQLIKTIQDGYDHIIQQDQNEQLDFKTQISFIRQYTQNPQ